MGGVAKVSLSAALHPAMACLTTPCDSVEEKPGQQPQAPLARQMSLMLTALIAPIYLFIRFFFAHDVTVGIEADGRHCCPPNPIEELLTEAQR